MVPYLGIDRIPEKMHDKLKYLDVHHSLKATGHEILGSVGDLRIHILEHHGTDTLNPRYKNNIRKLARLHLVLHALVGADE